MHRLTDAKVNLREKLLILFSAMVTVLLIITVYRNSSSPSAAGFWSTESRSEKVEVCDTKPCIELREGLLLIFKRYFYTVIKASEQCKYTVFII